MPRTMRRTLVGAVAATAVLAGWAVDALAQTKTVGVSWRHFQEERWKIDEAGIKSVLEAAGYEYVGADAQADPQKQLTDIEGLIARGVDALIIECMALKPEYQEVSERMIVRSNIAVLTNVREDEYGGSLKNRLRYPLEIWDAMRAVWPRPPLFPM